MKNKNKITLISSIALLSLFVVWTILVAVVGKGAIGPNGSSVGFATINGWFHNLTGFNNFLYVLTDWLGLIPFLMVGVFGLIGVIQWIKRKSIKKVDYSILILGAFYIIVLAVFVLFEFVVINRRPVILNGVLEASYPSSTTLLCMCVIPTAIIVLNNLLKNNKLKLAISICLSLFMTFMVVGRIIAGVHWITDIIGGAIFSAGIVLLYIYFYNLKKEVN